MTQTPTANGSSPAHAPESISMPPLVLDAGDHKIRIAIELTIVKDQPSPSSSSALRPVSGGYSNLVHPEPRVTDPRNVTPRFIGKGNPASNSSGGGNAEAFDPPLNKWLTLVCLWGCEKTTRDNMPYLSYRVRVEETGETGFLSCYDIQAAEIFMNRRDPANFRGTVRAILSRTRAGYLIVKELANT